MIIRELFARLGLSVDAASFAEGTAAVDLINFGLTKLVDTANSVVGAVMGNVESTVKYAAGLDDLAASAGTTTDALQRLKTESYSGVITRPQIAAAKEYLKIQKEVAEAGKQLWREAIAPLLPAITFVIQKWKEWTLDGNSWIRLTLHKYIGYVSKALLFVGETIDLVNKNWTTIMYLMGGVIAVFALLRARAIASAVATAAAWVAAAWPFILIGGLVAGLLLVLDDLRVYAAGGISTFGKYKKQLDAWLSPKETDPGWLKSLKKFVGWLEEALTKQGAIEGWFASIKQFFADLGARIGEIDWSPIKRFFGFLADEFMSIDWKNFALEAKAFFVTVGQRVKEVKWDDWLTAIKRFGLEIEGVYYTIKALVGHIKSAFDWLGRVGDSVQRVRSYLPGGGPRGEQPPAVTPARGLGAPGSGVLAPLLGAAAPSYAQAPVYSAPRAGQGTVLAPVSSAPVFHITQLPGESGEALAKRVAHEVITSQNEAAAAALPATE